MDESARRILDLLPQFVGSTDAGLRCRYANRAYAEFLGKSPESMIGVDVRELWGEQQYAEIEPFLERAMAGEPVSFSKKIRNFKGEKRFGKFDILPEPGGGYVVVMHDLDVVERHLKERERLVHELDHRVNNILQILESMLALESQSAEGHTGAVLDSIKARVDALALSYELLSGGEPAGGWPATTVLERVAYSIGPRISASFFSEPDLRIPNGIIETFVFIATEIARWAAADYGIAKLEARHVAGGTELAVENEVSGDLTTKAGAAGIALVESFAHRCGASITRGDKRLSITFPPENRSEPSSVV